MPTILTAAAWRALALPIAGMARSCSPPTSWCNTRSSRSAWRTTLTWGAFSYPFAFLVTDLTNRHFGAARTRRVVYAGFIAAVMLSAVFATPRIAAASGLAFLLAQLLDVEIFDRLRRHAWWVPPFLSSLVSSALDTAIFFTLAFSCAPSARRRGWALPGSAAPAAHGLPWTSWALFDYLVKLALAVLFILPYGALMRRVTPLARRKEA